MAKMNDWAVVVWVRIKCRNDEVAVLTWWSQGGVPLCLFHFLSTKQSENQYRQTALQLRLTRTQKVNKKGSHAGGFKLQY